MRVFRILFLVFVAPVLSFAAGTGPAPPPKEVFSNKNCAATENCTLKNFWIITEEYGRPAVADYNRGKFYYVGYETDSVERLEDYGIVAFLKGCVWTSREAPDGTVEVIQDGGYCNSNWTIKSYSSDPFYRQIWFADSPRHYYYRWNTIRGSTDHKTARIYGEERPTHPQLYVTFGPPTAFVSGAGYVQNVSLEVKLCLYKIKDVPAEAVPEDVNFASPVNCFERNVRYVYDHAKNIFE